MITSEELNRNSIVVSTGLYAVRYGRTVDIVQNLKAIGDKLYDVQETDEYQKRVEVLELINNGILYKEKIVEALDESEVIEDYDGNKSKMVFLGTVFSLYPSGKFYMPWACSNVEEWEAELDEIFREALDKEAESIGCWITCGEGDACDVFIGQCVD